MLLQISHSTVYRYQLPARSNINEVRLAPDENQRQIPGDLALVIKPDVEVHSSRDLFGNLVYHFEVEERHAELVIELSAKVETRDRKDLVEEAKEVPFEKHPGEPEDGFLHDFLRDCSLIEINPRIWRDAVDVKLARRPTWGEVIEGLSDYVYRTCIYEEQFIHVMTTAAEVWEGRKGTCQDFAQLLLAFLRSLGMPSRYMSGYLYDPGLDGGDKGVLIGAGQTHAWVEVHVPGVGWVGVDPTNRQWVNENYVSVAFGRDYLDVAPVKGSFLGGGKDRSLEVQVGVKVVR